MSFCSCSIRSRMLISCMMSMYSCGICMPCMYPHLLCNVDVMISTLQKHLQDALLYLVGPSGSFRIGSHLGRDKLVSETGCHNSYNRCFSKVEVNDFRRFLGYVLKDGYSWIYVLLVWVRYIASPVSPTPDCITRKFRELISGNSSSS